MKTSAQGSSESAVEEYLAKVPEPGRRTLEKMRALIRSIVPAEATETISYGLPAFRYKGALVAYGAAVHHCALYPMNSAIIETFKDELKNYSTSKGTIRFPLDKPLPAALVKKIVKIRVAENEARQKKR